MNRHEEEFVRTLAEKVRVFTLAQIAATWWSDTRWGRGSASGSLRRLTADGWLYLQVALSRPVQALTSPLVAWRLGSATPDFAGVAQALHRRAQVHAVPVRIVYAAPLALTLFSSGRAPSVKLTQMTHDLHVAQLYLHYRREGLPFEGWTSEDRLPRDWPIQERPDAVVRDDAGKFVRAVEYGGDYPASRLAELHAGLSRIGLGYELW